MAKIELGSTMYLFLQSPGTYAPALVISAHGGIGRGKTADKKVPFGTLHWYSKHGDTTTDFGIRNFIWGGKSGQRTESTPTGQPYYDYSLSKYQGRHAGTKGNPAETYAGIEGDQKYVDDFNQMLAAAGPNAPPGSKPAAAVDVLTVRNRYWITGVDLSSALKAIGNVHQYPEIHCYFCRSFT